MHVKPCSLGWLAGWLAGRLICTCFTCPGGSGRLICTCFTCPGGSGKLICSCSSCPGGSGRFICTYLTCPGGSRGVQPRTNLSGQVRLLPKNLRPRASEALRLAEARVLRVLEALGGSSVRFLHVQEAPGSSFVRVFLVLEAHVYVFYMSGRLQGGPTSNEPKAPGGSPS